MASQVVPDRSRQGADTETSVAAGAETGSPSRERPVDLVHLTRQTMGDQQLAQEILGLMVRQIRLFESRLMPADEDERRHIAHALKGAARTVGAFPLARAAAGLESDPMHDRLAATLGAEMTRVEAFIGGLRT